MASGFIVLEDGRCWARRWTLFDIMLKNICEVMPGESNEFSTFLITFLPKENDIEMGWGFIRITDNGTITRYIDLREFAPLNRAVFWKAAQNAVARLSQNKEANNGIIFGLTLLLKMHKKINKCEPPHELNDWGDYIEPQTKNKKGPGW